MPNTATRSSFRTPRCNSVKPEMSRIAFATPVTNSAPSATAGATQTPMSISGSPQHARAMMHTFPRSPPPRSRRAAPAPTSPPSPIAAFRKPTPVSPMSRSSIDATTINVMSRPRTKICATKSPIRIADLGYFRRMCGASLSRKRAVRSTPIPPLASAALSKLMPVTAAAAPANAAATSRLATTDPVAATSNPATSGPTKVPIPSPVLEATFAATSSPGVRAKAGRSADWIGRMSDPAPATTAASDVGELER